VVLNVFNSALVMRLADELSWIDAILPSLGVAMMSSGLAIVVVSLTALLRRHERSLFVWLTPVLVIVSGLSSRFSCHTRSQEGRLGRIVLVQLALSIGGPL